MNNAIERINKVLISDKYFNTDSFLSVIRSDLIAVALNYLEFDKNTVETALEVNCDGEFDFILRITANRLKCMGILPKQF